MSLKSAAVGKVLLLFLQIGFVLSIVLLLCSFVYIIDVDLYLDYIKVIDDFFITFSSVLWIILIIVFLIWIFRVHMDLRRIDDQYAVSPWLSIGSFVIPIYNLYGILNVFLKMIHFFKKREQSYREGQMLRIFLPYFYLVSILDNVLNRYYNKYPEAVSDTVLIILHLSESVYLLLCFMMTFAITRALQNISQDSAIDPLPVGESHQLPSLSKEEQY